MALNLDKIKIISLYSAIFGALLAIISLIPAFMPVISLFLLPFLSGAIVLITAKKINPNILKNTEIKDFAIFGGISGTICCAAYLTVFAPMVLILKLLIKNYYTYGIDFLNFFLATVLIISIMLIFFTTNAAGGLLAGFLINWLEKN